MLSTWHSPSGCARKLKKKLLRDSNTICRPIWRVGPDVGSDHLPMVTEVGTATVGVSRVREPKWAFHKADWVAFTADCETAVSKAGPQQSTVQELAARFTETVLALTRNISRAEPGQARNLGL